MTMCLPKDATDVDQVTNVDRWFSFASLRLHYMYIGRTVVLASRFNKIVRQPKYACNSGCMLTVTFRLIPERDLRI